MNQPSILTRPDGATIAYHRLPGTAPGVVFFGGFHSGMTGRKACYLDEYCRRHGQAFVRYDHFGHGASSGDASLGTIGRWAEDAVAVLDSLTEGPQILIGSSMGGWIMLLAALERPQRVHALVGIAPAPDFTEDLLWPRLNPEQRQELCHRGAVVMPSEYDPAGYTYRLNLFQDGRRHLVLRSGIALHCPVRLLHGMADASVPWRTSLALAERLESREVEVVLVKDGDHRLSRGVDLARLGRILDELVELQLG